MSDLFDEAENYDAMLQRGIKLSGESKAFFTRGRLDYLARNLANRPAPTRVLDFGCGVGDSTELLADAFPEAKIVGVDIAAGAIHRASQLRGGERVSFGPPELLDASEPFDACYVNGAFHHVPPPDRLRVMRTIHSAMRPGGVLAVFENNPWSVPARIVMRRIPFDADAVMVGSREVARLAWSAGFTQVIPARYLFVFPKPLAWLRPLEHRLERLALGAQYGVLAIR